MSTSITETTRPQPFGIVREVMGVRGRKLIVNADDFGFSSGINQAVREAFQAGSVSSASLMATGAGFEEAVSIARENSGLGVGVHISLVEMRPAADPKEIPTLLDSEQNLRKQPLAFMRDWKRGLISPAEVKREIKAQIGKVKMAGIIPTHVDSHKHMHAVPGIMEILSEVCRQSGISAVRQPFDCDPFVPTLVPEGKRALWIRQWMTGRMMAMGRQSWQQLVEKRDLVHPDYFYGLSFTGIWSRGYIEQLLASLPEGISELMTHPGFVDEDLSSSSTRLLESRRNEFELLTRSFLPLLQQYDIQLCHFGDFSV